MSRSKLPGTRTELTPEHSVIWRVRTYGSSCHASPRSCNSASLELQLCQEGLEPDWEALPLKYLNPQRLVPSGLFCATKRQILMALEH